VDGRGVPLSLVVSAANRHDVTQVEAVLKSIITPSPAAVGSCRPKLYADKGYDSDPIRRLMELFGYSPHVKSRNYENRIKKSKPDTKLHRWVVESCHSWLNRFRKILIRYEKTDASYLALLQLACAIIALRKVGFIYG
jgi:transposase